MLAHFEIWVDGVVVIGFGIDFGERIDDFDAAQKGRYCPISYHHRVRREVVGIRAAAVHFSTAAPI